MNIRNQDNVVNSLPMSCHTCLIEKVTIVDVVIIRRLTASNGSQNMRIE